MIDPVTGAATAVGAAFTPALSGTAFGFDFNPTVDRIRVVSDTGQNLRLNPDTGAVAAVDGALNPGAPHVVGSAYTNNFAGATTTTLYAIDAATDQLLIQNPPNNGTLAPVGPLGVDTGDDVGFDITANDGVAFATLTIGGTTRPAQDQPGDGGGDPGRGGVRRDAARLRACCRVACRWSRCATAPSWRASTAPRPGRSSAPSPSPACSRRRQLVGIDVRPADGQLYGVGSTSRLYLLNPITGAATPIGPVFPTALSGTSFGVDFNPDGRSPAHRQRRRAEPPHQPEQRRHRGRRHGAQSGRHGRRLPPTSTTSTAPARRCSTTSTRPPTSC